MVYFSIFLKGSDKMLGEKKKYFRSIKYIMFSTLFGSLFFSSVFILVQKYILKIDIVIIYSFFPIILGGLSGLTVGFFLHKAKLHSIKLINQNIKLQKSENQFRILMEQSPLSTQIFDNTGLTQSVNKAWEDLWQGNADMVVGTYNALEDPTVQGTEWFRLFKTSFEGKTVHLPDLEYDPKKIGKDGRTRIIKCISFPIINKNIVEKVVLMHQDMTDEHVLQEQLNHRNKMDAIGQLAGGVAHDFNNMLAGIMSASQLLQSPKRNLDEKSLNYVNMILNASNRAANLTAKLLAFGRKGKIISTTIDVHKLIDDAIEILSKTLDKKISIFVEKNALNHKVVGDNSGLQNSLMNLAINASHAMPDGGELKITTSNISLDETYCNASKFEIEPGEYIQIKIDDNGCGISLENINKIFEPFFTTKEDGKGTGLGLAAVHGMIQDHHGAINVYSEINVGTSFVIFLPNSEKETEEFEVNNTIQKGSGKILLVDDEELI